MPTRTDQAIRLVRSVLPMVAAAVLITWGLITSNIALVTMGAGALGIPAGIEAVTGRTGTGATPTTRRPDDEETR